LTFTEITAGFTFATTSAKPAGARVSAAARAGVINVFRTPDGAVTTAAAILAAVASNNRRCVERRFCLEGIVSFMLRSPFVLKPLKV
jgi:hypothetical protein